MKITTFQKQRSLLKRVVVVYKSPQCLPQCLLLYSIFCNLLFWLRIKENSASLHIYLVDKQEIILIGFSGNHEYSLILHQKLKSGSFLKVICHVKSETILMNVSNS